MTRYLWHFLGSVSIVCVLIPGFNWLVDPYAMFGAPQIAGFNMLKPAINWRPRIYETYSVLAQRPEAVILGTSRADLGIDPRHRAFEGMRTFNAALGGQLIYESRRLLEQLANSGAPPRLVVIGLDFHAVNARALPPVDFSEDNFSINRSYQLPFSLSTFRDSMATVWTQKDKTTGHQELELLRNGFLDRRGYRLSSQIGVRTLFRMTERGALMDSQLRPPECDYPLFSQGALNDLDMNFRRILSVARAHSIDLRIFIPPSHARYWETVALSGLWPRFEEWKRWLVRINEEEAVRVGKRQFAVWDFSGYNSITTESVPPLSASHQDMKWYWESSHFKKEVGDIVLDRIFGISNAALDVRSDFGRRLDGENIELHLLEIRAARVQYRATHLVDVEEVERMHLEVAKLSKGNRCDGPSVQSKR